MINTASKCIIFAIGMVTVVNACYYDNEVDLYPDNCSTTGVTYSGYVKPFIDNNCSCHVKGSINGGVNLDGYILMKTYVSNGKFIKSIKHESGVSPMPPSTTKTGACEISKLDAWITGGALNN